MKNLTVLLLVQNIHAGKSSSIQHLANANFRTRKLCGPLNL